jgi:hypothetical protein
MSVITVIKAVIGNLEAINSLISASMAYATLDCDHGLAGSALPKISWSTSERGLGA